MGEESTPAPADVAATETPLAQLNKELPAIFAKAKHKEMWGVDLVDTTHIPTTVVLQKFLRANNNDVALAKEQLTKALAWRKKMQPSTLLDSTTFDSTKFGDLGYVTVHKGDDGKEVIITWNIYGAVKDNKATFGNVEEFIKWRVALMEIGVRKLNLAAATTAIPDDGTDPYQMIQVHDYLGVSFFRMDPHVKAASRETIQTFSMAYPELLSHKYFVNVPAIMGWVFGAMKLFLAAATLRKFHPMTSGTTLATELKPIVSTLPSEYGGKGSSVKEGMTVKLAAPAVDKAAVAEPVVEGKPEESVTAAPIVDKPAEASAPATTVPVKEDTKTEVKDEAKVA